MRKSIGAIRQGFAYFAICEGWNALGRWRWVGLGVGLEGADRGECGENVEGVLRTASVGLALMGC
jgi:hypothetical protein